MHSVRVSSQLLVSVLFIAVPTNTEIYFFFFTCIGIMKVFGFLAQNPTYKTAKHLLCDSMATLFRQSQAQKYPQINSKLCIKLL